MNKKTKIFVVFYFLVIAIILIKFDNINTLARTSLEYVKCGSSHGIPKPIPQLTTIAFTFLLVGTPLILIASSIITLMKTTASGNSEEISKAKLKLLKKFIISAIIFLVSFLVQFVVNRVTTNASDKDTFSKCLSCFLYYSGTNCPNDPNGSGNGVTSNTTTPSDKHNNRGSNRNSNTSVNNIVNTDPGLKTGTYGSGDKYALYVPETVDSNKPLIVFLHGIYERGNNLSMLASDAGFYASIQQGKKFNTYILMPQINGSEYWSDAGTMSNVKALIDRVVEDYGIDKNRISLWGFSLGANQAPSYIQAYPDYFASNVLISCKSNPNNPTYYKNVPTYVFVGTADDHSKPGAYFAEKINGIGGKAKVKTYQNQNHGYFVTRVINDTDLDNEYKTIFDWMFAQRKN